MSNASLKPWHFALDGTTLHTEIINGKHRVGATQLAKLRNDLLGRLGCNAYVMGEVTGGGDYQITHFDVDKSSLQ